MAAARRLRVLAAGLNGGASSSPSAAQITEDGASITELDAPALLSDADVKQFLVDGCLALPMTDLPVGFHRELQAKSRAGFESLRAEGITEDRYVYEQLPAMSDILSSPVLRGALISLLGEGYVQHPHRSMHVQGDIEDEEPRLGDGGWCRPNRRVLELEEKLMASVFAGTRTGTTCRCGTISRAGSSGSTIPTRARSTWGPVSTQWSVYANHVPTQTLLQQPA